MSFEKIKSKEEPEISEEKRIVSLDRREIDGKEGELNLEFLVLGSNEKSERNLPILIIPGFGESLETPKPIGKILAKEKNEVILVSGFGAGGSGYLPNEWLRYKNRDLEGESKSVAKCLDKLRQNPQEKMNLIGFSLGAITASTIAKNFPEKVENLVLIHPVGLKKQHYLSFAGKWAKDILDLDPSSRLKERPDLKRIWELIKDQLNSFSSAKRLEQRLVKDGLVAAGDELNKNIGKIKANILIIAGSEDDLSANDELGKLKEKAEVKILEGKDHFSFALEPEKYAKEILGFLSK